MAGERPERHAKGWRTSGTSCKWLLNVPLYILPEKSHLKQPVCTVLEILRKTNFYYLCIFLYETMHIYKCLGQRKVLSKRANFYIGRTALLELKYLSCIHHHISYSVCDVDSRARHEYTFARAAAGRVCGR